MLLEIAVLAYSFAPAQLSGIDGIALLKNLTNGSENISSANNTTSDISYGISVSFSGANGSALLSNLTNNPANLSWGSKPRTPHPSPSYRDALFAQVIHDNHV
ncbi:MAG: hypothetical protein ACE14P_01515 [Methanotrichaceae archaeon]